MLSIHCERLRQIRNRPFKRDPQPHVPVDAPDDVLRESARLLVRLSPYHDTSRIHYTPLEKQTPHQLLSRPGPVLCMEALHVEWATGVIDVLHGTMD
jgi:hypothetical protein